MEAMRTMQETVTKLPNDVGYEWTATSHQVRMASAQPLHANPVPKDFVVRAGARTAATKPNEKPGMLRSWADCFSWLVIFAGFDFLLYEVVKHAVKGLLR